MGEVKRMLLERSTRSVTIFPHEFEDHIMIEQLISKEINDTEHEYINMCLTPLIDLPRPLNIQTNAMVKWTFLI